MSFDQLKRIADIYLTSPPQLKRIADIFDLPSPVKEQDPMSLVFQNELVP